MGVSLMLMFLEEREEKARLEDLLSRLAEHLCEEEQILPDDLHTELLEHYPKIMPGVSTLGITGQTPETKTSCETKSVKRRIGEIIGYAIVVGLIWIIILMMIR